MAEAWDTARIREAFIYNGGEAEYHDPEHGAQTQRQVAGEIFDRWLAAHDAEVRDESECETAERLSLLLWHLTGGRLSKSTYDVQTMVNQIEATFEQERNAGVVAEEPEWEYGVGWNYVGATVPMGTRYPSRESAEDIIRRYPQDQDFGPNYLVRRRPEQPAGPWMPVKREGEEQ